MTAIAGYVVLAAIAVVLCFTRRGRGLMAAAGDALDVFVREFRSHGSERIGWKHVQGLGALVGGSAPETKSEDRTNGDTAASPSLCSACCDPADIVDVAMLEVYWRRAREIAKRRSLRRFQAIESSRDERWVM